MFLRKSNFIPDSDTVDPTQHKKGIRKQKKILTNTHRDYT